MKINKDDAGKHGYPAVFKELQESYLDESLNENKPLVLYLFEEPGKIVKKILNVIVDQRQPEAPKDTVLITAHGLYRDEGVNVKRDHKPCTFTAIVNPLANKAFVTNFEAVTE